MGKMTIQEIAKILVEKNKLTVKEANQFAATMFEIIQQRLNDEGLVKIKGLGTFKMIRVEARESVSVRTGERVMIDSHAKITFTPDATMKELVNKPFSQFETVILNEGVEFDDLADDITEEEQAEAERMEEDTMVVVEQPPVEQPPVEQPPVEQFVEQPVEEPVLPIEPIEPREQQQPLLEVVEDEKQEKISQVKEPTVEPESQEESQREEPIYDEEDESCSWKNWLGYILLTLVLMAASAYGGYWYGQKTANTIPVEPVKAEPPVVVIDSTAIETIDSAEAVKDDVQPMQQPVEEIKPEVKKEPEVKQDEEPFWKKYEAMDARVRTGAYHIIGTDHEVKARKGETLARIARRELGEGMSCYMEVYNGMKPDTVLKEGQVVKVPKLKWKKKKM